MKQIDFNRLFMQDQYQPLVYKVRNGANGAHDILFFNSYIHDATIFLEVVSEFLRTFVSDGLLFLR